jgi:uncharacterized integral membrane protein
VEAQALWAFGSIGALGIVLTEVHRQLPIRLSAAGAPCIILWVALFQRDWLALQHEPVIQHVASHPEAVWLVGPFFAAVTGVAFKEGLCYGKAEAAGLFFVTPALLLGHLTGWVPEDGEKVTVQPRDCMFSQLCKER